MPMGGLGIGWGLTASVAALSKWVPAAGASTFLFGCSSPRTDTRVARQGAKTKCVETGRLYVRPFFVPPVRRKQAPGSPLNPGS